MAEWPRAAVVHWLDAHGETSAFNDEKVQLWHRPIRLKKIGWVLRDDEIGVTLAVEIEVPGDGWKNLDSYRDHHFIPRCCIQKVEYLRTQRKR